MKRGLERAPIVIAVDGPAASGKGTLARRLASAYRFAHLDTGRLYRATAWLVLHDGLDPHDRRQAAGAAARAASVDLTLPALGEERVAAVASKVAALREVRAALLQAQQDFCESPPDGAFGAVLDGRDIGTVIRPQAEVKLFIDASVTIRAERRFAELRARDFPVTFADIERDLRDRDARDAARAVAPLKAATDAFVIDTDELDADAVFAETLSFVSSRIGSPPGA